MKWEEIYYFIDFIQSENIKNPKILDIGCGNGRLLGELKSHGIISLSGNYTGVDASSGMIEEAKKTYPKDNFHISNMKDLEFLSDEKYDYVFFIASFHHLETSKERLDTLKKVNTIVKEGGYICMTNWSLQSELNKEKYISSIIKNSENEFGGADFFIKLGEYKRFYHCFSLSEIESLAEQSKLRIRENREFENKRNFITIMQK